MSDDTPLGSMAHLFIPKLRLTNPLVVACYFISICLLQTIANDFSTFISVNPNMGNTSSLMCRKEQCRSAVHLAIQCHRKAGCLGWIYDDIINMPCLLCQCPTHPYHFNRHSLALQSVLNVFDTPRIEKVPDIVLPMDDIQGSVLQGTIVGTVYGGANIVPGRVGGALRLNGVDQNVKFGPHPSACYHAFQECPHGVTWAMWLKLEGQPHSVILETGGCDGATGYKLLRNSIGVFKIRIKNTTHTHDIELKYWKLGYWVHLMFSLHPVTGGALYLNGCRVTDTAYRYFVYTKFRYVNRGIPSVLGSKGCNKKYSAMDIDSLLIWYDILTPEDVWKFYLHGGEFTF